jgi:hypothetical protein
MLAPGAGAGNQAAAVQQVKSILPGLLQAAMAWPAGSKEQQAVLRAVSSLNPIFGKAEGQNMVPAGIASLAAAAKGGGPLSAAPPPGITSDTSKPPPGIELPPGA